MSAAKRVRRGALSLALAFLVLLGAGLLYLHEAQQPSGRGVVGAKAQRIVYRVEDFSQLPVRLTTQVLDAAPPYTARLLTLDGPPPGGLSLGGLAWDASSQYLIEADGSVREIQQTAPSFPGGQAHLDVALPTALRFGLVRRQGIAVAANTRCTQWLSKEPLDSAQFSPPTSSDRVVTCVDGAGQILREEWTLNARRVRLRTAVMVGRGPDLSGSELFAGKVPVPAPTDVSSELVKSIQVDRLVRALGMSVPAPPTGLRFDRAVAIVDIDRSEPAPQTIREGGVLSFTDGRRLVVLAVKRGLTSAPDRPSGGVAITVPGLRSARLTPNVSGLRLEALTSRGLLVVITGDVHEQVLVSWAGRLRFT